MKKETTLLAGLGLIGLLRLIAGAVLPLSADEAYYWLWSRHLAAGYFDHPPAIAHVIRVGTFVFGDTAFGVRLGAILLSFAATWAVWQSAEILLPGKRMGLRAALFFNLALMTTVEMMAATPDAPQVFAGAAFLWTLLKVAQTGEGRWWLAVGVAGGVGLLSKYSMLFLGVGALVWLLADREARRWLATPWPYAGGILAALIFAPNIVWNAQHDWATFGFQFGRLGGSHLTLRYFGEFIGSQLVLASPFLLVLGLMGLTWKKTGSSAEHLLASLFWPSVAYFLVHCLHDRVQGNWPCYLFPVLAVAAVRAWQCTDWQGRWQSVAYWSTKLAVPVAAVLLVAGYAQALLGVVPMGRKDPLARLLAVGMPDLVSQLEAVRTANGAGVIYTTDYATTAWFSFYSRLPVVSLGEDYRWPDAPLVTKADLAKPALYIFEVRKARTGLDRRDLFAARFAIAREVARFDRSRKGVAIAHYSVWRVEGAKTADLGRKP